MQRQAHISRLVTRKSLFIFLRFSWQKQSSLPTSLKPFTTVKSGSHRVFLGSLPSLRYVSHLANSQWKCRAPNSKQQKSHN
jgi:hypothetical protein